MIANLVTFFLFWAIFKFVIYGKHSPIKSFLKSKRSVCLFKSNTGSEFSSFYLAEIYFRHSIVNTCRVRLSSGHQVPQSIRI